MLIVILEPLPIIISSTFLVANIRILHHLSHFFVKYYFSFTSRHCNMALSRLSTLDSQLINKPLLHACLTNLHSHVAVEG